MRPRGRFERYRRTLDCWGQSRDRSRRPALASALRAPAYHPCRWCSDGKMTASNVQELRPKGADSEKITINLVP
jgi:hypothetical protein